MPQQKKYYNLMVLGCQMNKNDAERLATILETVGYSATEDEAEADLVGVVSCAVRQSAMDRIHGKLRQWQLEKAKRPFITLLSGCVLQHDREALKEKFDIFIDIKKLDTLPEQIKKLTNEQIIDLPSYFKIQPKYRSTFLAYVPIATGCNKFCTYCAVPYTRGKEVSRPATEILEEIRHLVQHGYKEIVLVGQNVNSYGLDIKDEIKFSELVKRIDQIEGDYWLRFMTSHPYDMSDDLIAEMVHSKHLSNYLHLPVQSGDDDILKKMNRHYTITHYKERIDKVRQAKPTIGLSTDVIVGFCGESEQQFQKTIQLFKDVKYDMAYISQYSVRSGTAATKLYADDVSHEVKEQRERELNEVLAQTGLAYNQQFVDKTIKVLVDSRRNKGQAFRYQGKNSESKTVNFNAADLTLIGNFVMVKITEAKSFGLEGELVV